MKSIYNTFDKSSTINLLSFDKSIAVVITLMMTVFLLQTDSAFAKSPQDFTKKLKKGYHQLAIGNTDKAIKIFSKFAKRYPESGACHTALGQALKRRGKINEAKAEFLKATQVEPKYPKGHYYLGVSYEQEKNWRQAANSFQKFVELDPNNSNIQAIKDRVRHCRNQI